MSNNNRFGSIIKKCHDIYVQELALSYQNRLLKLKAIAEATGTRVTEEKQLVRWSRTVLWTGRRSLVGG